MIAGFSDYIIKIDMSKDNFQKHFFGPEGNSHEYSVIAFDDGKPVGLILGGIKVYEGLKTLRCGALCVLPGYRGTEVSHKLFDLHREIALENNCSQMFLEVIAGNERAINFYRKKGYEKVYDLVYYSHSNPSGINTDLPSGFTVQRTDIDALRSFSREMRDIHINWQNDFDYTSYFDEQRYYGVFKDANMVGGLSIHPAGRVNFLWVDPRFRNKGIGGGLINHAVKELNLKKLAISFPSNASLTGFVKRLGFMKDPITQYEMYLTI
jgi:ribosomal protein S18 acetylase RimI-like enzyme